MIQNTLLKLNNYNLEPIKELAILFLILIGLLLGNYIVSTYFYTGGDIE